jgi:hypothetical protein
MAIVINNKMKQLTILFFLILFFSCKQDSKINLPELKGGYYQFEILEKYVFFPEITPEQKYALSFSQIMSKPGFLIQKTSHKNEFSACITYSYNSIKTGCSPVNFPLNLVYINNDSIYLQKPWFYIDGSFTSSQHVPWNGSANPTILVDSTLKYQVQISGLKLNNNSEIEGYWREIFQCRYVKFEDAIKIDSIVDQPLFVKFKLKFVKGI